MDKGNQQSTDSSTKVTTTTTTQLTAGRDIGLTGQTGVDLARTLVDGSNVQAAIWAGAASDLFTGVASTLTAQAQSNTAAIGALAARAPNDAADLSQAVTAMGRYQLFALAAVAGVGLLFILRK